VLNEIKTISKISDLKLDLRLLLMSNVRIASVRKAARNVFITLFSWSSSSSVIY